jgi:hypothetical protein
MHVFVCTVTTVRLIASSSSINSVNNNKVLESYRKFILKCLSHYYVCHRTSKNRAERDPSKNANVHIAENRLQMHRIRSRNFSCAKAGVDKCSLILLDVTHVSRHSGNVLSLRIRVYEPHIIWYNDGWIHIVFAVFLRSCRICVCHSRRDNHWNEMWG